MVDFSIKAILATNAKYNLLSRGVFFSNVPTHLWLMVIFLVVFFFFFYLVSTVIVFITALAAYQLAKNCNFGHMKSLVSNLPEHLR